MQRRPLLQALPATLATPWIARPAAAAARKVLRLALASPETTLDPVQTNSDSNTAMLLSHILESPLQYDYLARPAALLPCTAQALPEVSADGRVFTLRIRPGIFFADDPAFGGRPRELVAADYVYAIKRFFDPRWNSSDLYVYESLKLPGLGELRAQALKTRRPFDYDREVEGVRAPDRHTLRITLGVADPRFVHVFADAVVMGAVAREVVEHYGDDVGAHPVGTGPFRLRQWRRGSRIVLERQPGCRPLQYTGTPADTPEARAAAAHLAGRTLPLVDELVFDVVEEGQPRWLSFLDGSHHALEVPAAFRTLAAPGGQIAPFLARRGITLQRQVRPDMVMNFFFMQHPLVGGYTPDKVALRRAIALAFDGPALRSNVFGGQGVPAQSVVAPFTSGYDPAYKSEMSDFDPARANALLDMFGYRDRDGDGWRETPEGQPLVLQRRTFSEALQRQLDALWQKNLKAVGLRVEFPVAQWPENLKAAQAGNFMVWTVGSSASQPDGLGALQRLYGPSKGGANLSRFQNEDFDRIYRQLQRLPDGREREALFLQAKRMSLAWAPYRQHVHRIYTDMTQPWLVGYRRPLFWNRWWHMIDIDAARRLAAG